MAVSPRRSRKVRGRSHDDLAGIPVDAVAGRSGEVGDDGLAVLPEREEAGDHVVARRELRHDVADRLDHAGAVRHGYPSVCDRHATGHHAEIVVVQRARMDPDADLAKTERAGILEIDIFKMSIGFQF
jgi:hypothetical protein